MCENQNVGGPMIIKWWTFALSHDNYNHLFHEVIF